MEQSATGATGVTRATGAIGATGASGAVGATGAIGATELVTGEAVALDVPVAGVAMRVLASVIDVVALGVLMVLASIAVTALSIDADDALSASLALLTAVAVVVIVPTVVETVSRGKSLGKLICGLRTVRDDLGPIGVRHALTRHLVGVIEVWGTAGAMAFVAALVSPRTKRLGDTAAGTLVVRDRVRLRLRPPLPMPPELAAWAAGVDLGRLPDASIAAARAFLQRAPSWTPQARDATAQVMAADLATYVAPQPPPGTPPMAFLVAVLAENRAREERRLARDEAFRRTLFRPEHPSMMK